jgi:hypothetical protein
MGKRFTIQDVEKLRVRGMVNDTFARSDRQTVPEKAQVVSKDPVSVPKKRKSVIILPTQEAPQLLEMKMNLTLLGYDFKSEHQFSRKRKFRLDIALLEYRIGIEYEGIFKSEKSRHITLGGYSKDTEKYNLAILEGWTVLRYTANTYKRMIPHLEYILNSRVVL